MPTRLTPGGTNRLFVACAGAWRGYFPLSGDVYWNPRDATAPYALIFDPRRWTPIAPVRAPGFRGWRYLDAPPGDTATSAAPDEPRVEGSSPGVELLKRNGGNLRVVQDPADLGPSATPAAQQPGG